MDIQEMASRKVMQKALSKIDLDAIAEKLAPKLQAEMEKGILKGVSDTNWAYIFEGFMDDDYYSRQIDMKVAQALGLTPKPLKKKGKK